MNNLCIMYLVCHCKRKFNRKDSFIVLASADSEQCNQDFGTTKSVEIGWKIGVELAGSSIQNAKNRSEQNFYDSVQLTRHGQNDDSGTIRNKSIIRGKWGR